MAPRCLLAWTTATDHPDVTRLSSLSFATVDDRKLGYIPALDGLRALAIVAVMLYHLKSKPLVPGGFLGVDLFFVLSGFLITTLLLQEWGSTGRISLTGFYLRRALRLLPALVLYLGVYSAVSISLDDRYFAGDHPAGQVLANAGLALAYCYNWFGSLSNLELIGFRHLWSLSVEEQFYVIWPSMLFLMLLLKWRPSTLFLVTLSMVVVAAVLPFVSGFSIRRLYFGTDFRLLPLLSGALLAQMYVSGFLSRDLGRNFVCRSSAYIAFAALLLMFAFAENWTLDIIQYGLAFVAVISCVLIGACLFSADSFLVRALSCRALSYVGRRSYALYLWHDAFRFWLRDMEPLPQIVVAFAFSFLAAELSYRLVEAPALALKSRIKRRSKDSAPASMTEATASTRAAA